MKIWPVLALVVVSIAFTACSDDEAEPVYSVDMPLVTTGYWIIYHEAFPSIMEYAYSFEEDGTYTVYTNRFEDNPQADDFYQTGEGRFEIVDEGRQVVLSSYEGIFRVLLANNNYIRLFRAENIELPKSADLLFVKFPGNININMYQ